MRFTAAELNLSGTLNPSQKKWLKALLTCDDFPLETDGFVIKPGGQEYPIKFQLVHVGKSSFYTEMPLGKPRKTILQAFLHCKKLKNAFVESLSKAGLTHFCSIPLKFVNLPKTGGEWERMLEVEVRSASRDRCCIF